MGETHRRLLGDLVMSAHFAFFCFVVFGGALLWRSPPLAWLHMPAVVCTRARARGSLRLLAGHEPAPSVLAHFTQWIAVEPA